MDRTLSKFGPLPNLRAVLYQYLARNSTTLRSGGNSALSRFSWRKVSTGVKCNFSSPHHHIRKIVGKLSIRQVRMWDFTRIGPKTKKVVAFDISGTKAVWAAQLGTTPHLKMQYYPQNSQRQMVREDETILFQYVLAHYAFVRWETDWAECRGC